MSDVAYRLATLGLRARLAITEARCTWYLLQTSLSKFHTSSNSSFGLVDWLPSVELEVTSSRKDSNFDIASSRSVFSLWFSSWILCNLKVISLTLPSLVALVSLVSGLDSIFTLLIASTNQLHASLSSGFGHLWHRMAETTPNEEAIGTTSLYTRRSKCAPFCNSSSETVKFLWKACNQRAGRHKTHRMNATYLRIKEEPNPRLLDIQRAQLVECRNQSS